ncbi:MAG: S41 family peptidase [Streptosporangiales bacterium]
MADGYLRFPDVHGDLVAFVAEDDVWLAPLSGGRAWRLSVDRVPASHPRFSPDGETVAWTSVRDGAPEVYAAPVSGGPGRRLTYWGAARTRVRAWTPDSEVVAVSEAGQPSRRRTWAHAIPRDGGEPRRLPYGVVGDIAFGPNGSVLVATPGTAEPAWWKRYRGGTASKLWLDRTGDGSFERLLPGHTAPLVSPMWVDGRIYLVTDHEGTANVYVVDGDLRRVTAHAFYARHATSDGRRIVYQVAGELWTVDEPGAEPRQIEISLGSTRPGRQPWYVNAGEYLGPVAPDTSGRASAVEVRGTVQWVTHREGPVRTLAARPGVRARLPVMLGTRRVAWVTDAEGEDAVEIAPVTGTEPGGSAQRLATGQLGRVLELVGSPDGGALAVASHDGRLSLVDAETGALREVARSAEGAITALVFSPDSAWLAWSQPTLTRMGGDLEGLRQIRLAHLEDLRIVEVTAQRFLDYAPVFTRDGKHLAFLSVRSFDPVYDAYVFDLSFPNGCRPYLVPLAATTPSPFDAEPEGRAPDSGKDAEEAGDNPPQTVVDVEGLQSRVRPFPVPAARYTSLRAVKGGVAWLRQPVSGEMGDDRAALDEQQARAALERFDLARRRLEVLAEPVDEVYVSGDGTRLVLRDGETLRVVPSDRKVGDDKDDQQARVEVDLTRVRARVEPGAEWRQSFDEAGRLMRDHYWRADMGGVDWAGVLARYRLLVDRLGCHDDLVDLLWEVQGELGTSHAYTVPPAPSTGDDSELGLLGADLRRDGDGTWRVDRILPGESSDPRARSPLLAPGVAVRGGDAVLAVDGTPVDADAGPAPLLLGTAGKPVELTVRAPDGAVRRVVVTPLADETPLRYQDWVAGRRAYVREQSGGRLGYLHLPDMMSAGWAQLHRDLRVEMTFDGVLADMRENGGGHTSQLVLEKLSRRVIGWDLARDMRPEPYPLDAPRGPVVGLINEWTGSDGDIVSAAIKRLGIGPLVGARTWGGVIGIDMAYRLVDGTVVTQPRYSFWLEGQGWGVENYGVDPDIEVDVAPQDLVAGRDPQLDTAIRIALDSLGEHPPARPPDLPPPAH